MFGFWFVLCSLMTDEFVIMKSLCFARFTGVRGQRSADDGQLFTESDPNVRNDAGATWIYAGRKTNGRQIHRHPRKT